jgi:hypothetical protein
VKALASIDSVLLRARAHSRASRMSRTLAAVSKAQEIFYARKISLPQPVRKGAHAGATHKLASVNF